MILKVISNLNDSVSLLHYIHLTLKWQHQYQLQTKLRCQKHPLVKTPGLQLCHSFSSEACRVFSSTCILVSHRGSAGGMQPLPVNKDFIPTDKWPREYSSAQNSSVLSYSVNCLFCFASVKKHNKNTINKSSFPIALFCVHLILALKELNPVCNFNRINNNSTTCC